MENGVKINTYHWELSAAGKVLTMTATAFRTNGPVTIGRIVASRISGSNGFAGQWRDGSYLQRRDDMTLSLNSQALHIAYPDAGPYINPPFDAIDAALHGPYPPDAIYTARLVARREILVLTKRDGKVLTQDSLQLSTNGRVITETWWDPDHPNVKSTFVYEKP